MKRVLTRHWVCWHFDIGLSRFFFFLLNFILLNLLRWHWLIKLYRFQSVQFHTTSSVFSLCVVHHPKSSLFPSPHIPPLSSSTCPHPSFLWQSPYCCLCLWGAFCLSLHLFQPTPSTPLPSDSCQPAVRVELSSFYVKVALKWLNHAFLCALCGYISSKNLFFILCSCLSLSPTGCSFKFYEKECQIYRSLNSFTMSIFTFPASCLEVSAGKFYQHLRTQLICCVVVDI